MDHAPTIQSQSQTRAEPEPRLTSGLFFRANIEVLRWHVLASLGTIWCVLLLVGCNAEADKLAPKPMEPNALPTASSSGNGQLPALASSSSTPLARATFAVRTQPEFDHCGYHNGREANLNAMLEIVGGGVGCVDYDGDGRPDLLFPRGGHLDAAAKQITGIDSVLLHQDGHWHWTDCTDNARIVSSRLFSHGVLAADMDADGCVDLLVYGYHGIIWMRNQGDGTFIEMETQSLHHTDWTTAAAAIDIDNDQLLDLYLGSYVDWSMENNQPCPDKHGRLDVCSPNVFGGTQNSVWLNNGSGTFTEAHELLQSPEPTKTLGVLAAEFSPGKGTGIYVANDLIPNSFFTRRQDRFEEHAHASGVAVDDEGLANGSMGLALLDFNLDLLPDLFVTNFEHEKMALYINQRDNVFQHASRQAGLNRNSLNLVGFGVAAADFDGDADEDVIFTAGRVHYRPEGGTMEQLPAYLQNEAGRTFTKCDLDCPFFHQSAVGRGLAASDLDGDGDLDFVATQLMGIPSIVENTTPVLSNWISLTLVGRQCSRTPVGATVELQVGGLRRIRQHTSGGSYLSHNDSRLHFAWPAELKEPAVVAIRWPDGTRSPPTTVAAGAHHTFVQPKSPESDTASAVPLSETSTR
ncbi:MAG: CRTAC1 family protein [Pirellulaceae bacterium]|nr:CRTAC1 family protein [Pirellulaceae bacterium]